jgi:hypothetical protein
MTSLYNPSVAASQTAARRKVGGKSELRRAVRRVTPGQGNLKESGTENIPPEKDPDVLPSGRGLDVQPALR